MPQGTRREKQSPRNSRGSRGGRSLSSLLVGLGLAAVGIVLLGVWPGPIPELARYTAAALLGG